jgi:hypothetical protein
MAMEEDEIIGEFEVSFNFKNVLYVCQVQPAGSRENPYYKVEYFSPNGKGIIPKLATAPSPDGTHRTYWKAFDVESDHEFLQEMGKRIEEHDS